MSVSVERLVEQPTVIEQAQEMAGWFGAYIAHPAHQELGVIPGLAQRRLAEQVGDEIGVKSLFHHLTALYNRLDDQQRHNFELYICGYPEDALNALAIGDWQETVQLMAHYFQVVPECPARTERQKSLVAATVHRLGEAAIGETWYDDARCSQIGGDPFFVEKGGSTRDAQKICAACPVSKECLTFALDNNISDGIWGGLSFTQRQREKTRRKRIS